MYTSAARARTATRSVCSPPGRGRSQLDVGRRARDVHASETARQHGGVDRTARRQKLETAGTQVAASVGGMGAGERELVDTSQTKASVAPARAGFGRAPWAHDRAGERGAQLADFAPTRSRVQVGMRGFPPAVNQSASMKLDAPILALDLADVEEVVRALRKPASTDCSCSKGRASRSCAGVAADTARARRSRPRWRFAFARTPMIVAQLAYDLHAYSKGASCWGWARR